MYGHIAKLAQAVKKGVDSVEGMEGVLYQVAETLSDDVLGKMHAPPKAEDVPMVDPRTIAEADGFVFGFPTRFGMMCAQMKAFFDATGGLWQTGALVSTDGCTSPCCQTGESGRQGNAQNNIQNAVCDGQNVL
jgi:NAD(P)H dehydrogenase (quinone)